MNSERKQRLAKAVMAAPGGLECPNCGIKIEDLHMEWYPIQGNPELGKAFFRGQEFIDCPVCKKPIWYQGLTLQKAPSDTETPVRRSIDLAINWAKSEAPAYGRNLLIYLQDSSAGRQYQGYFTEQELSRVPPPEKGDNPKQETDTNATDPG